MIITSLSAVSSTKEQHHWVLTFGMPALPDNGF